MDAADWERGERRRGLFRAYKGAWLGPLAAFPPRKTEHLGSSLTVWQGLLRVMANCDDLLALAAAISEEAWAWVDYLHASGRTDEDVVRLAGSPLLRGPACVTVAHQDHATVPTRGIEALATTPYLEGVRRFEFWTMSSYYPAYRGADFSWDRVFAPLRERFGERLVLR